MVSELSDRTAPMSIAPTMPATPAMPAMPTFTRDDDAPERQPGVRTGLRMTGRALANAAAGTMAGDSGGPKSTPSWALFLLAILGGGGSGVGLQEMLGPDKDVVALTARVDAQDNARKEQIDAQEKQEKDQAEDRERLVARVDATERAIAAAEVTRVTEVRHLIKINRAVLSRMGVPEAEMPELPPELSTLYRDIEVETLRKELFPTTPPAPTISDTMPRP
jgi:hypothetical protein